MNVGRRRQAPIAITASPHSRTANGASGVMVSSTNGVQVATQTAQKGRSVVMMINGTQVNPDIETADQLSGPAQKLIVTPERLLAAVKASVPEPPALPPPPKPDDLINRLARNLGLSPDKVRAAITQVADP